MPRIESILQKGEVTMLGKFFGMTNQSLDVKNRFVVPSKFRLGRYRDAEVLFMLVVVDKYPHIDFFFDDEDLEREIIARRAEMSPHTPRSVIDYKFHACRDVLLLDKQGRTNAINARFLADACIKKDMVVLGNGSYFSAYDIDVYERIKQLAMSISESRTDASIEATYADDRMLAAGESSSFESYDGQI